MARDDGAQRLIRAAAAATEADATAASAMRLYRGLPWLEPLADLGDQPQLRTLCVAAIAAGLAAGRSSGWGPRLARAGLRMLIAHEAATFAKDFVKRRIDRTRPRSLHRPGQTPRPKPGTSTAKEETSFPSGHSAGAAAVARAFSREFPEHGRAAAGGAGVLALVQVPRCAHYPTDIAAGLAVGLAAEAAVAALWRARPASASEPSEAETEPSPCAPC
ncbi:MAG TPA: phosphatase PAP2 family protein [Allosphingosinicella sp.]|nr:phosphatase PAP2 family protein [Allosphingosinicella sp.]